MARIMSLHDVQKKIVLNRGSQFTSRFWKSFHENKDTKLNFSTTYHPQTDGQTERTNQVLEDVLRAFVPFSMVVVGTRVYLMLSSHIIVTRPVSKMSPFETLYDRKYRTPLF
jgi:transposase InsO family protein